MAIVKEAYSSTRVNLIYQLLKNEAENGQPKEYDIRVDDLKVISRTTDPERFHGHEEFVLPETKSIVINIYDGTSNRCTRYNLMLKEEQPSGEELSGIEKTITSKMLQERKKWEYDLLKKDYDGLQQQLSEAEEYVEELKAEITNLRDEKHKTSNKLTETIVSLAGMYLSRNPNALSGIPLIGGLLGGGSSTQSQAEQSIPNEVEATFKREEPKTVRTFTGEVSQDDIEALELALIPFFKEEHLEYIGEIIECMHKNNNYITYVYKGLQDVQNEMKQTKQAA